MGKFKDISCQKFSRLTVLHRLYNYHKKGVWWLCVCECGGFTYVTTRDLNNGHTKSCGCLRKKHGKRDTRLSRIWRGLKNRCYNVNNKDYRHYGKRGIAVCSEWLNDFMTFYNWSINNGYKDDLTIDRIDNSKGYSPDNCRWVDYKIQNRNRSNTKLITYKGETKPLMEWCELLNLKYDTVLHRLNASGWTIERALELEE